MAVPPIAPIVDEAALFVVVMVMPPVESMLACRLLAASAVLSWFSVETWPVPVPKVMLVAVPPAGGADRQRLAGERGRSDVGRAGGQAERGKRAVPRAGDDQVAASCRC